jgi:hypothetical protein
MTPNLPLIDDVMHHIDTHPEEWDQTLWFCDTTACFAGHTALISGLHVNRRLSTVFAPEDRKWRRAASVAEKLLGLDSCTADRLFCAGNTLDDLHQVVKELHGAPHQPLSWEPKPFDDEESA